MHGARAARAGGSHASSQHRRHRPRLRPRHLRREGRRATGARRHVPRARRWRSASPIRRARSPTSSSPPMAGKATCPRRSRSSIAGSRRWPPSRPIAPLPRSVPAASRRSSSACTGRACRSATRSRRRARPPCCRPGALGDSAAAEDVDTWAARIADTPRARARDPHHPRCCARRDWRGGAVAGAARRLRDVVRRIRPRRSRQRGRTGRRPGGIRSGGDHRRERRRRGQADDAAPRHRRHGERALPLADAPALVLEDEGSRALVRRERRARAARAPADRRAARALSPHGPQLRLHRRFGDRRRPGRRAGPAAAGRLAVPRPRRAVALVVCQRHPVCGGNGGLLPSHRQARPRARSDRHDALVARHGRRPLLSARRASAKAARPRQRPAGLRRHRLVRHPGRERASRTCRCARRTSRTASSRGRSTTSRRARSSRTAAARRARTATSPIPRSRMRSGRRRWRRPCRRRRRPRRGAGGEATPPRGGLLGGGGQRAMPPSPRASSRQQAPQFQIQTQEEVVPMRPIPYRDRPPVGSRSAPGPPETAAIAPDPEIRERRARGPGRRRDPAARQLVHAGGRRRRRPARRRAGHRAIRRRVALSARASTRPR